MLVPASVTIEQSPERLAAAAAATSRSVLDQIKPLATKFMGLLQVEHLRPSVVDLLSLMSQDAPGKQFFHVFASRSHRTFSVRQTIALCISSMALGPENPAFAGYVELLTRFIWDGASHPVWRKRVPKFEIGRLKEEATDYMILFLAPTLITHPKIPDLCRRKILAGLWCRYSRSTPKFDDKVDGTLIEWFCLALFGRHVIRYEAETWSRRMPSWLK
jgi:hypothetical protein